MEKNAFAPDRIHCGANILAPDMMVCRADLYRPHKNGKSIFGDKHECCGLHNTSTSAHACMHRVLTRGAAGRLGARLSVPRVAASRNGEAGGGTESSGPPRPLRRPPSPLRNVL